jgi:hypothetical protein
MQPTLAQLIRSAAEPVLELALMGGVGALLAHKVGVYLLSLDF